MWFQSEHGAPNSDASPVVLTSKAGWDESHSHYPTITTWMLHCVQIVWNSLFSFLWTFFLLCAKFGTDEYKKCYVVWGGFCLVFFPQCSEPYLPMIWNCLDVSSMAMLQRFEKEHDSERKDSPIWSNIKRNMSSQIVAPSLCISGELAFL